jgi:hypothetical protein
VTRLDVLHRAKRKDDKIFTHEGHVRPPTSIPMTSGLPTGSGPSAMASIGPSVSVENRSAPASSMITKT